MHFLVEHQGREPPEGPPAFGARVQLPRGVDFAVIDECGAVSESFPTLRAHVWLLAGVHPLVSFDARLTAEGLPAPLTLVGVSLSVALLMLEKGCLAPEGSPTLLAPLRGPHLVNPPVLRQVGAISEVLPTLAALVGLLLLMNPMVFKKM